MFTLIVFVAGMVVQGFAKLGITLDSTGCRVYYGKNRRFKQLW